MQRKSMPNVSESSKLKVHERARQAQAIRDQVKRIRKNIAPKQGEVLSYVIEEWIKGEDVNEISIALGFYKLTLEEFYYRNGQHGHERAAAPRGLMRKLRKSLVKYYANADSNDFIEIRFNFRDLNPTIAKRFEEINAQSRKKLQKANEARMLRTAPGFEEGIRLLTEILEESREHPVVLARLADLHSLRAMHGITPPGEDLDVAFDYAQRALRKSTKVWEAYAALGGVYTCRDWDRAKAEDAFESALDLVGTRIKSMPWYRAFLISRGLSSELIEELEVVIGDLADIAPALRRSLGIALMFDENLAEAEDNLKAATPHHIAHLYLSVIYDARGQHDKALEELLIAVGKPGSEYVVPGFLVMMLARAGKHSEALVQMKRLESIPHYIGRFQLAVAEFGLGNTERALDYLEAAAQEREYFMLFLPFWPMFRSLRTHPRFQEIVKRMNLSQTAQQTA